MGLRHIGRGYPSESLSIWRKSGCQIACSDPRQVCATLKFLLVFPYATRSGILTGDSSSSARML